MEGYKSEQESYNSVINMLSLYEKESLNNMVNNEENKLIFFNMKNQEIIDNVKNIADVKEEYGEKFKEFYDEFCNFEDGTASKRIVERVWGKLGDN